MWMIGTNNVPCGLSYSSRERLEQAVRHTFGQEASRYDILEVQVVNHGPASERLFKGIVL